MAKRARPLDNIALAFSSTLRAWSCIQEAAALVSVEQQPLNSPQRLAWESDVLARAIKGERVALAELYNTYAQAIFSRVLMPKLGNRQAAEDALSETFRVGFERLVQFEQRQSSVYFWFARIAANKATDMHRARRVSGRMIVNLEAQMGVLFDAPETPDALLSGEIERRAFQTRLQHAMDALNPRYRQVLELRFFKEHSREECAQQLGIKVGTLDVLLLRATKALRKAWDELAPPSSSRRYVRSESDGK